MDEAAVNTDVPAVLWSQKIAHAIGLVAETSGEPLAGLGENPAIVRVTHHFTPGLYARECWMPEGSLIISKIHKTEHPFVITAGSCWVFSPGEGRAFLQAPHFGVTKPGTQRVLVIESDTTWITFHATDLLDPVEIERMIIQPFEPEGIEP